jgi:hypothetical protein
VEKAENLLGNYTFAAAAVVVVVVYFNFSANNVSGKYTLQHSRSLCWSINHRLHFPFSSVIRPKKMKRFFVLLS